MAIEIYKNENSFETALKIFEDLMVHQSCTVHGFEEDSNGEVKPKGELVMNYISEFDVLKNCKSGKRRRVRHDNQVGDFIAQKAFKWAKRTVDGIVRYDIWRIQ